MLVSRFDGPQLWNTTFLLGRLRALNSMSTRQLPAGLGIDIPQYPIASSGASGLLASRKIAPVHLTSDEHATIPASASEMAKLRSVRGMQGLLRAELGEAMVEFDAGGSGDGSYFKDGRRIALDITPQPGDGLPRLDTMLNFGASPEKSSKELRSLLGNANARLKSGASVLPAPTQNAREKKCGKARSQTVSLEQAKSRARVEVDIILQSNSCVQGDHLRGHIKLRVRKRAKKEAPVLLADGKVRIIGFECIPNEDDRYTFYQHASSLSAITGGMQGVYDSPADSEGFAEVIEGVHVLPFSMYLPEDGALGSAKGVLSLHSGISVRYIAMISVKVKDAQTDKRSIAHFYRSCEIWPRLNPRTVLTPAARALQASTAKSLSMLSSNSKVKVTALLPRLTWVAGQRCYVRVCVANETKKTVKSLTLTLVRTVTTFRPRPALDAGHALSVDPDACQTSTSHKVVAETILEMSQHSAKGHASAKGWWTGVSPGQELDFSHYILLPPDALSIARSRLLEVEYAIRVTLSAGSLTSDVCVSLPVRIINFLSIDPPPNVPSLAPSGSRARRAKRRRSIDGELSDGGTAVSSTWSERSRASVPALPALRARGSFASCDSRVYSSSSASSSEVPQSAVYSGRVRRPSDLRVTNPDSCPSDSSSPEDDDGSVYSTDSRSRSHAPDTSPGVDSELSGCSVAGVRLECLGSTDDEADFVFVSEHLDGSDAELVLEQEGSRHRRAHTVNLGDSCASRTSVQRPTGPRWTSNGYIERGRKGYPGQSEDRAPAASNMRTRRTGSRERSAQWAFASRVKDKLARVAASQDSAGAPEEEITPRLGISATSNVIAEVDSTPVRRVAASNSQASIRARGLPVPPPSISGRSSPEMNASVSQYSGMYLSGCTPTSSSSKISSATYTEPRCFASSTAAGPPPRPPRARRPTDAMLQTGTSTGSVKGRIAELEERVRSVQGGGPAYA